MLKCWILITIKEQWGNDMKTGIVGTIYKTGREIFIYESVGSVAENVMLSLGYGSDDYWFRTFEFEYCKRIPYRIKGKNRNDLKV
jgi:hypothetical protein